eukprot:gnl/MRDRNA2_/MRDRNA2_91251_c0_seq1.p1 gnl/MRDRNA2_/MRDRNA2_91251_c0~~gnl/MRDRNA2_/MRDRNA2_91251_c0_seq1.p1  ORF type:complete len:570 (+),score=82.62 gnl/MRDRNA2_/MRDRNA2_91251_c0_seq1:111-1820(+)
MRCSKSAVICFGFVVLRAVAEELVSCPTSRSDKGGAYRCTSLVQMRSLTSRGHAPADVDSDEKEEAGAAQPHHVEASWHDQLNDASGRPAQLHDKPPLAAHPQLSPHSKSRETIVQSSRPESSLLLQGNLLSVQLPEDELQSDRAMLQPHQISEAHVTEQHAMLQNKISAARVTEQHTMLQNKSSGDILMAGPLSEQSRVDDVQISPPESGPIRSTLAHFSTTHSVNAVSQHVTNLSILLIQQLSNYSRTAMMHAEQRSKSLSNAMLLALREPPTAPTIFLAFGLFTVLGLGSLFLCSVAVGGEQHEEQRKIQEPGMTTLLAAQMPAQYQTMHARDDMLSVSARTNADAQFCPELVVPAGRECVLLVPMATMASSISTENQEYQVVDLRGNSVLRVALSSGTRRSLSMMGPERGGSFGGYSVEKITLMAEGTEEILAYCIPCAGLDSIVGPGKKKRGGEFTIHHSSGELFGNIQGVCLPDWEAPEERYVLCGANGRLHFWGALEDFALNVTDDQGVLLATTERCSVDFVTKSEYFRLRVAPLADVGLILCGLLSASKLEVSRFAQPAME